MWDKFKEDAVAFVGGCLGWGAIFWRLLFGGVITHSLDSVGKILLTGIGAIVGGFGTAWGKHLFDKYKNRKNDKRRNNKTSKRA